MLRRALLLLPALLPSPARADAAKDFAKKRDEALAAAAREREAPALSPEKTAALKAKHRSALVKLWEQAGAKGLWREQAGLVAHLAELGTDDPKARKALGMLEIPGVGWCWVLKSPHYEIRTNLPPGTQVEILEACEDTYEAFTAFFRPYAKIAEPKTRFVMHYFDTYEQYHAFLKAVNKPEPTLYGFYDPNDGQGYFRKDETLFGISGILYHEGTHQLHDQLLRCMNGTPSWVTEGLASYFETLERRDGKLVLGSEGRKSIWHLGGAQYIPLDAFFDVAQKDWTALPDRFHIDGLNAQYGQAALLVRYFVEAEEGKLKDRFLKEILLKSLGSSKDVQKALGTSPKELEPKYVEFANRFFQSPVSAP